MYHLVYNLESICIILSVWLHDPVTAVLSSYVSFGVCMYHFECVAA